MKKKIFPLLVSVLALTGCDFLSNLIPDAFNPFKKDDEQTQQQQQNQGGQQQQNDDQHEEEQHEEDQHEEHQDEKDELLQTYTATIKLSGNDFHDVATAAGVQINDTEYANNVNTLKEYCDSFLEYLDLITSLNCTKLNTAEWGGTVYLCVGTGYYANGKFSEGILKWNSGVKIYNVEIKAQAYAKENPYSGDIIDYPAHVWIDSDDHSLEVEEGSTPEIKTFSKAYPDGTNSFSIKSTGARVLLQEITITWRG